MPIYAYKCSACGFAKDALQKLSDPALTTCPQCGQETFSKQLTAAGFQLKGSGWYVTDFRDKGASAGKAESTPAAGATSAPAQAAESGATASASESKPAAAPAAPASDAKPSTSPPPSGAS